MRPSTARMLACTQTQHRAASLRAPETAGWSAHSSLAHRCLQVSVVKQEQASPRHLAKQACCFFMESKATRHSMIFRPSRHTPSAGECHAGDSSGRLTSKSKDSQRQLQLLCQPHPGLLCLQPQQPPRRRGLGLRAAGNNTDSTQLLLSTVLCCVAPYQWDAPLNKLSRATAPRDTQQTLPPCLLAAALKHCLGKRPSPLINPVPAPIPVDAGAAQVTQRWLPACLCCLSDCSVLCCEGLQTDTVCAAAMTAQS